MGIGNTEAIKSSYTPRLGEESVASERIQVKPATPQPSNQAKHSIQGRKVLPAKESKKNRQPGGNPRHVARERI